MAPIFGVYEATPRLERKLFEPTIFTMDQEYGSRLATDAGPEAPPVPRHPFYMLPAELILDIIDLLPPESFINFTFANYPLLLANGLAPALSPGRVSYLTNQTRLPQYFPLLGLPVELTTLVMSHLKPIDIMRFVVANYQVLARQGIAPHLSSDTIRQLRKAVR